MKLIEYTIYTHYDNDALLFKTHAERFTKEF